MSNPIATPADLALFLPDATIDTARATLILDLAQSLCESIFSPITSTARPVVIRVAARAYANATSAHSLSLGTAGVSYGAQGSNTGIGGLFLSRTDKADLRRLNGRGGAFTINLLPAGVCGIQNIFITGAPAGGTYTLTYAGQTTAAIALGAASLVQDALSALSTIGFGNVAVIGGPTPGSPLSVKFIGALANTAVSTLTATSSLTGGTAPTVHILVVTPGSATSLLSNIPPWDYNGLGMLGVSGL